MYKLFSAENRGIKITKPDSKPDPKNIKEYKKTSWEIQADLEKARQSKGSNREVDKSIAEAKRQKKLSIKRQSIESPPRPENIAFKLKKDSDHNGDPRFYLYYRSKRRVGKTRVRRIRFNPLDDLKQLISRYNLDVEKGSTLLNFALDTGEKQLKALLKDLEAGKEIVRTNADGTLNDHLRRSS